MKPIARRCLLVALVLAVCVGAAVPAFADSPRSTAQTSVNSTYNPNYNPNVNANYNPNVNANYNPNVYVNRNAPSGPSTSPSPQTNLNVDAESSGGAAYGCCYHEQPPATPFTAGTTMPATGESLVKSTPPDCSVAVVNNFIYRKCGTVWYQPQITGSSTTYVVVAPPN
jgi:hypothetical protein